MSTLLFLEALFFVVLAPLLPSLKHELRMSTSQAGLLVAMYGLGSIGAAIPATICAARVGARAAALLGLVTFAATSVLFGLAQDYPLLLAARFAQGAGGAACWTGGMVWLLEVAPASRRGELLGIGFGVAEAGAILGPVLGDVAARLGRAPTFGGVAAISLLLALVTARTPPPPADQRGLRLLGTLSCPRIRTTMWLAGVPALVLSAIGVLAPLQLHRLGAGPGEIALSFGVAAAAGILVRLLAGRLSDRRGPSLPIKLGLLLSIPAVLAIPWPGDRSLAAALVVAALLANGIFWPPLMAMLSDACVASGAGQVTAVAVMGLSWPPGNILGAAGGGALAQAAGQRVAYSAMAAMLLAGYLALARQGRLEIARTSELRAGSDNSPGK
ncbi:MAG: MFS transporter [Solirubrobacteraceae bacterium]